MRLPRPTVGSCPAGRDLPLGGQRHITETVTWVPAARAACFGCALRVACRDCRILRKALRCKSELPLATKRNILGAWGQSPQTVPPPK